MSESLPGVVNGRLVRTDGSPISRFQINGHHQRDPQGRFSWKVQSEGEVLLAFAAPELAGTIRRVRVSPGETVDLGDVVLGLGRPVRVRVVDAQDKKPVFLSWLRVVAAGPPEHGGSLLYDEYDPDEYMDEYKIYGYSQSGHRIHEGEELLEHLEERPLELRVKSLAHVYARVPLAPDQREVTVELRKGAHVSGKVRVAGDSHVSGHVQVLTLQGGLALHSVRIKDGWYVTPALEAGSYLLRAEVAVYPFGPFPFIPLQRVEVPEGGQVKVDLEAQQGGRVQLIPEEPVHEAVLVTGAMPMPESSQALEAALRLGQPGYRDDNDHHWFRDMPAGLYTLFLKRAWDDPLVHAHSEPLHLPGEGEVVVRVQPKWRVLP